MASPKVLLGRLLGPLVFRKASVTRVQRPSPRFALIELEGAELRDVAWTPGDKVQLFLPDEGMRTYTPTRWDARGASWLLAFAHGASGPGARWASAVREGDAVQLFGPRRSLDAGAASTRVAVLGDETSLGLAAALAALHDVTAFLEVDDADEARAALAATGARAELQCVPRTPGDAHLSALADAVRSFGAPLALFSGRAKSIQSLRALLRGGGASKTKAYWADGKRGLDGGLPLTLSLSPGYRRSAASPAPPDGSRAASLVGQTGLDRYERFENNRFKLKRDGLGGSSAGRSGTGWSAGRDGGGHGALVSFDDSRAPTSAGWGASAASASAKAVADGKRAAGSSASAVRNSAASAGSVTPASSGASNSPTAMRAATSLTVPSAGSRPVSSSNSNSPAWKTSDCAVCGRPCACSGDRHARVSGTPARRSTPASPKSTSATPLAVTKTFSAATSRCKRPSPCASASAPSTGRSTPAASSSDHGRWSTSVRNGTPSYQGCVKYSRPPNSPRSRMGAADACVSARAFSSSSRSATATRASRSRRSTTRLPSGAFAWKTSNSPAGPERSSRSSYPRNTA